MYDVNSNRLRNSKIMNLMVKIAPWKVKSSSVFSFWELPFPSLLTKRRLPICRVIRIQHSKILKWLCLFKKCCIKQHSHCAHSPQYYFLFSIHKNLYLTDAPTAQWVSLFHQGADVRRSFWYYERRWNNALCRWRLVFVMIRSYTWLCFYKHKAHRYCAAAFYPKWPVFVLYWQ